VNILIFAFQYKIVINNYKYTHMSDDKKIIFSMVNVSKQTPQGKQIIKDIYLSFFYGAKIGILGLNGAGKSTVLKIIAGLDKEHQGEVHFAPGYSVGYLPQEPQLDPEKTVMDIVKEGAQETVDLLKEYEDINAAFMDEEVMNDADKMDKLIQRQGQVQEKLDQVGAWDLESKLELAMDALRTPPGDTKIEILSGGEKRRVALCRLLLQEPDILLLDEPNQPPRCRICTLVRAALTTIQRNCNCRYSRPLLP
jgi:sulfate-transporting ATPase